MQNAGLKPQITTVFHRDNFSEMEAMYDFLCDLGIESWRPINIEPIGRACESRDLLLSPSQFNALLSFIREKRFDRDGTMEFTFGCSHYLGLENERVVRDHYFCAEPEFLQPVCDAMAISAPVWMLRTEWNWYRATSGQMILWRCGKTDSRYSGGIGPRIVPDAWNARNVCAAEGIPLIHGTCKEGTFAVLPGHQTVRNKSCVLGR